MQTMGYLLAFCIGSALNLFDAMLTTLLFLHLTIDTQPANASFIEPCIFLFGVFEFSGIPPQQSSLIVVSAVAFFESSADK